MSEVVLEVPPLRERREDIPALVEHFVEVHRRRHDVEVRGVSRDAWRVLQSHPWPGNVRDLSNAISRGVVFAAGGWIRPQDLRLRGVDEAAASPGEAGTLTMRQRETLASAVRHGRVRRADLVSRFHISGEAARRDLAALVRAGLLRRECLRGIWWYVPTERNTDRNTAATPPYPT